MRSRLPPGLDNLSPDGSLRCVKLFDMTLGDDNVLEDPATNDPGCKLDIAKRGFGVQVKNTFVEVFAEDEDVTSVGAVSAPECHLRSSLLVAEDDSRICGETSDKTSAEVTEATGIAAFQRFDACLDVRLDRLQSKIDRWMDSYEQRMRAEIANG